MNSMKSWLLLPLVLILFAPSIVCAADDPYRIGREDVLDVNVWDSRELTQTVTVASDGSIAYPIIGNIQVAGLTPQEVANSLQEKLAQGYVKDPKITVTVKEYNSKKILVFGEVVKPGLYKLKGKIPLLELLFLVGGGKQEAKRMTIIRPLNVSEDANPTAITTDQEGGTNTDAKAIEIDLIGLLTRGDLSQNIFVMPGDTIYVSSGTGQKFYILGQVSSPGPYEWVQDMTLLEALKLAGGPTEGAAVNRITVRKNEGGQETVTKVNLTDIMKGKKKDDVIIKAGDVIVVPESWI